MSATTVTDRGNEYNVLGLRGAPAVGIRNYLLTSLASPGAASGAPTCNADVQVAPKPQPFGHPSRQLSEPWLALRRSCKSRSRGNNPGQGSAACFRCTFHRRKATASTAQMACFTARKPIIPVARNVLRGVHNGVMLHIPARTDGRRRVFSPVASHQRRTEERPLV